LLQIVNISGIAGYLFENYFGNFTFFKLKYEKEEFIKFKTNIFATILTIYPTNNKEMVYNKTNIDLKYLLTNTLKFSKDIKKCNFITISYIDTLRDYVHKKHFNRVDNALLLKNIEYEHLRAVIFIGIILDYFENYTSKLSQSLLDNITDVNLKSIIGEYMDWYNYLEKEELFHIEDLKPTFTVRYIFFNIFYIAYREMS